MVWEFRNRFLENSQPEPETNSNRFKPVLDQTVPSSKYGDTFLSLEHFTLELFRGALDSRVSRNVDFHRHFTKMRTNSFSWSGKN